MSARTDNAGELRGLAAINAAYERGFFHALGLELELSPYQRLRITRRAYRDQYIAGARAAARCSSSVSAEHG